ncbi:MAG TPA: CoA pyrophosphatase [Chloroflexia bacterium]|nr:CoA pyrophosphatase [Chloroflexia bacterium]
MVTTIGGPAAFADGPPPRAAAVLLLLYPDPATGHETIVFTRRTAHLPTHAGQISFPGGSQDPDDADAAAAALREAHEELGIPPAAVTVVGTLPPVHTVVSNYLITPIIGHAAARPAFVPNPGEVAEVIEVPVAGLRVAGIHRQEVRETPRGPVEVHYFEYGPYTIWGATARILHIFLGGEPLVAGATPAHIAS